MKLYRISPKQFLENYNGLGASYRDGARWNKAGTPVLYFALSPAVALLEMSNYLPSPRLVPKNYQMGVYELPDSAAIDTLPEVSLPANWGLYPYPASTQTIGDDWLKKGDGVALLVPSTAVPAGLEQISVLNPNHPDCKKLHLTLVTDSLYNDRMFSGIGS